MTIETVKYHNFKPAAYSSSTEHLQNELEKLDKILAIKLTEFREHIRSSKNYAPFAPGFISDEEIAWLMSSDISIKLAGEIAHKQMYTELYEIENKIEEKIKTSDQNGIFLPLVHISRMFNLSRLEYQTIIICLAPELRRRYDRIYAYLQDDITRKKPSLDLILRLCCKTESERWEARHLINDESNLSQLDLIHKVKDQYSPSGSSDLASFVSLDKRLLDYILGSNSISTTLKLYINVYAVSDLKHIVPAYEKQLLVIDALIRGHSKQKNFPLMIHLSGSGGTGKKTLVLQSIRHFADSLMCVDMALIASVDLPHYIEVIKDILKESVLYQMPIYFENIDVLSGNETNDVKLRLLFQFIKNYHWIYFSSSNSRSASIDGYGDVLVENVCLGYPTIEVRYRLWKKLLKELNIQLENKQVIQSIAEKFILAPLGIKQIILSIGVDNKVSDSDLIKKCQAHSNHNLVRLATKIPPGYGWDDIVLPADTKSILQTVCKQVNHKYHVFHDWGFEDKLRYGRGLSVLFCGSPGTGKTMGAQVMANELNLDLYKIDLSNVVSKYIGETEKNLNKVFSEAETSNAILFFDECDALFGKRTEVSDAHDRYANLEVSFLLQKMEEYDGIVILATNLRGNMDDAFIRRIRFIVEFPFPDIESRQLIWEKAFPTSAPCSDDIEFNILAKKLKLSGGNIKNIVLNAAFLAADDDSTINMVHMLESAREEYKKIGKSWNEKLFVNG